ncbi:hypothetical protein CONLIGDRAFT_679343 [Coniochaeta ligniaria NRRL 30616]|uniref:Uncharacterized protein n=1 Tax=Coniochaeta ligniaria NRRL 30616 TaxID=1408157 RepID=A0A1J7JS19_9PEZI|nr:hypothetical protein CONLIGDRAFT_679343 [Coniochaeta ligniaria NRRL 30616]
MQFGTPLKHFAWEWLRYTDKFVSRPLPAVPGVHIWLIDYELRRGVKQERKTEAQGHRHVDYMVVSYLMEVRQSEHSPKSREQLDHQSTRGHNQPA